MKRLMSVLALVAAVQLCAPFAPQQHGNGNGDRNTRGQRGHQVPPKQVQPPKKQVPPPIKPLQKKTTPPVHIQPPTRRPPLRVTPPLQKAPQHQVVPLQRIDLPRTVVVQKARLGQNRYGQGTHALGNVRQMPTFGKPPRLNRPGGGQVRRGYFPYQIGWRDSNFAYPYYSFYYSASNSVPSPWYYYPQLPGYVVTSRIRIGAFSIDFVDIRSYAWRRSTYYAPTSYDYPLDITIDRLVRVYENRDMDALDALVPGGYDVDIESEDGDNYMLSSNDFHDLMLDNMSTTRTVEFAIVQVQTFRAGARVRAIHTFVDPSGRTTRLQHVYVLEQDERGFHIASLQVSRSLPSF